MKSRIFASFLFLGVCATAVSAGSPSQAAATCDQQLVMRVDSAKLSVEPDGFSIDAFGMSESAGWKSPSLIVVEQSGDTAVVNFVACRPEVSAQVLTPIKVNALVDLPLDTKKIVIVARTNTFVIDEIGR